MVVPPTSGWFRLLYTQHVHTQHHWRLVVHTTKQGEEKKNLCKLRHIYSIYSIRRGNVILTRENAHTHYWRRAVWVRPPPYLVSTHIDLVLKWATDELAQLQQERLWYSRRDSVDRQTTAISFTTATFHRATQSLAIRHTGLVNTHDKFREKTNSRRLTVIRMTESQWWQSTTRTHKHVARNPLERHTQTHTNNHNNEENVGERTELELVK